MLTTVQAQLRKIGVEVVPVYVPNPAFSATFLPSGQFDVALFGWRFDPDPAGAGPDLLVRRRRQLHGVLLPPREPSARPGVAHARSSRAGAHPERRGSHDRGGRARAPAVPAQSSDCPPDEREGIRQAAPTTPSPTPRTGGSRSSASRGASPSRSSRSRERAVRPRSRRRSAAARSSFACLAPSLPV